MTAAVTAGGPASESPRASLGAGRALNGRYRLLELIGSGGAGEVYAGHDPQLDRPVAVKRLRADVASSADRVQLAREARINARLEHPNIVRVYDFLTAGNDDYIVSEYIDGSSLDELLTPEHIDVDGYLATALAIIRGLAYAHAAGVVHLDLKTENVLIGRDGVPKIADFGIAQLIDPGKAHDPSSAAVVRGTFRSMSPEQTLASAADTRSDLFSFGTLLYELFGGVSPFHVKGNAAETIRRIREYQPLPLRELRADVPAVLSELVEQLHRKQPADRPRAARDVEAVLRDLSERRTRRTSPLGVAEPPVERRLLSVLSLELCLPGPGANMEQAESYLRAAARFQKAIALLLERHDGHLLSSLGHRAVVCLGYPRAHDNNCQRAARLFLELRHQLAAEPLPGAAQLRGGLDVGETLLFDGIAAGPSLAAAAALCDAAAPGELRASSHAQRILRRFFTFEFRGELALPPGASGSEAKLRDHYALLAGAPGSPLSVHMPGTKRPMIGREPELRALFEAFAASEAGTPHAVLVVGAAGVGKSRLLDSFSERLAESSATVIALRARPEDQYSPFAPFADFLAIAGDAAQRSRVRASGVPRLEAASEPPPPPEELPAADSFRQRMIDTSIGHLLRSSKGQGLVIIVEDVHWLDHSSFELLRTLQARNTREPVLIVLSARPEIAPDAMGQLVLQTLSVSRLALQQALEVVHAAGGRKLAHRVAMQIVETADGLPLLIEELTQAAAEGSDLAWAVPGAALPRVPSSLTESLDRRLELLGVARDTAQLLAAFGRETVFAILERVSELPVRELEAQLARLCAVGLVVEEGEGPVRTLRFRHGLLCDAIYERLPAERREQLHRRIAATAASLGAWLAERPDLFALHLARSGQWRQALELAMLAGEQAARKGCHFEACVHLQRALELLGKHLPEAGVEHDRLELAIRRLLLPSLNASDGWAAETVQANNARLLLLGRARAASKPLAESWALFAHACLRHDRYGVNEALEFMAEAPASAARDAVLAVARGNVEFYQGEFSRAERSLRHARQALANESTREAVLACGQELLVEGPCYLAWLYAIQGRVRASAEQRREMESSPDALVVSRAFGMLFSTALGLLCRDHASQPAQPAQRARAEALLELADRLRHPVFRAVADVALGRLRLAHGELDAGLETMRRGYELYEQSGTQLCLAEYAGFVAEAQLEAGRVVAARELIERVREQAAHPYCGFYRAEFLRIDAEIAIAEGRLSEATRAVESARACAAAMAIDRHPQLFAERIAATYQRLRAGASK